MEGKSERECRRIFQELFNTSFPKSRPKFLMNHKTGRNLEFDGYSHSLKLAFEYNGKQHYYYPNFINMTKEQFIEQIYRDKLKLDLSDSAGVYLIIIPYTVPFKEIKQFIIDKLPPTLQTRIEPSSF